MKKKANPHISSNVILYFQVHQPWRLCPYFQEGDNHYDCFNNEQNAAIVKRVAEECYIPANKMLLDLIKEYPQVRVTFSLSGTVLDQLSEYSPEALETFKALAKFHVVEFLAETDHHSLASLLPGNEFEVQVLRHIAQIEEHLGVRPQIFRNTDLIYNNDLGTRIRGLGFNGVFIEGVERVLRGRSSDRLYEHPEEKDLYLLVRNHRLSDDIGFHFNDKGKKLTVNEFISRLNNTPLRDDLITLGIDYATFGEHQKKESGILEFLKKLIIQLATEERYRLVTPSEAIALVSSQGALDIRETISWADQERDLSAWLGNDMQHEAFDTLSSLESRVKALHDSALLETWRRLLTSDHFYNMSVKRDDGGAVNMLFNYYDSPQDAFTNYKNILTDLSNKIAEKENELSTSIEQAALKVEAERREIHRPLWAKKLENSYEK